MAGMGPPPKDPRLRQRRNKASTAATLPAASDPAGVRGRLSPALPKRKADERPWHAETLKFWKEVWASPMAGEYIACDVPGLVNVARLQDAVNYGQLEFLAELRLQRQCFGLTPLDRRRLQWETERGETAERRREMIEKSPSLAQPNAKNDPRQALRAVK
jgi:hypothetical protein